MKPNPCNRCGRVPTYGVGIGGDSYVFCQTCDINLDIPIEDWNAMNSERPSDCPVESQEPVEQTCGNCRFRRNYECCRFPPRFEARTDDTPDHFPAIHMHEWCGEWRAK